MYSERRSTVISLQKGEKRISTVLKLAKEVKNGNPWIRNYERDWGLIC